jgi:hypothetical protein
MLLFISFKLNEVSNYNNSRQDSGPLILYHLESLENILINIKMNIDSINDILYQVTEEKMDELHKKNMQNIESNKNEKKEQVISKIEIVRKEILKCGQLYSKAKGMIDNEQLSGTERENWIKKSKELEKESEVLRDKLTSLENEIN